MADGTSHVSEVPPLRNSEIELPSPAKPLCSACQSITAWIKTPDKREGDYIKWPFQPSFAALQTSALSCSLCKFVLEDNYNRKTTQAGWNGDKGDEPYLYKVYVGASLDLPRGVFEIFWREEPPYPSPYVGKSNSYYISNPSISNRKVAWQQNKLTFKSRMQTVLDWISDCKKNHPLCKNGKSRLPRRILDLETVASSNKIKLVDSQTLTEQSIQYATLSHCWGPPTSKPPLKTISSNIDEHFDGISIDRLTLNFYDAVLTCCKLGLRYLWIDSLCIIQDSKADWEAEASKMADIYLGSYVNLAVAAAQDAHGGFIGDSSLRAPETRLKTIQYRNSGMGVESSDSLEEALLIQRGFGADDQRQLSNKIYPYFERGWVLQELALSPRTVLFPKGQMFWQCRQRFGSEDDTVWSDKFQSIANEGNASNFNFDSPLAISATWGRWVESYSQRRLTYASDVASAIAGLVQFFSAQTSRTSILGLWKENLSVDLGWNLSYRKIDKPPPQTRREGEFPSWSWLSVLPQADLAAQLQVSTPDEKVVSLELECWEEEWSGAPYTSKLKRSKLVVSSLTQDATVYVPSRGRYHLFQIEGLGFPTWTGYFDADYQFASGSKIDVKVVHLYQILTLHTSGNKGTVSDYFLVLRRHKNNSGPLYRIGVGQVSTVLDEDFIQGQHCNVHFRTNDRESVELV